MSFVSLVWVGVVVGTKQQPFVDKEGKKVELKDNSLVKTTFLDEAVSDWIGDAALFQVMENIFPSKYNFLPRIDTRWWTSTTMFVDASGENKEGYGVVYKRPAFAEKSVIKYHQVGLSLVLPEEAGQYSLNELNIEQMAVITMFDLLVLNMDRFAFPDVGKARNLENVMWFKNEAQKKLQLVPIDNGFAWLFVHVADLERWGDESADSEEESLETYLENTLQEFRNVVQTAFGSGKKRRKEWVLKFFDLNRSMFKGLKGMDDAKSKSRKLTEGSDGPELFLKAWNQHAVEVLRIVTSFTSKDTLENRILSRQKGKIMQSPVSKKGILTLQKGMEEIRANIQILSQSDLGLPVAKTPKVKAKTIPKRAGKSYDKKRSKKTGKSTRVAKARVAIGSDAMKPDERMKEDDEWRRNTLFHRARLERLVRSFARLTERYERRQRSNEIR